MNPVACNSSPVKLRGDKLDPVLWQGEQWAVTEHGIERRDGCYVIDGSRLLEKIDIHGWPEHMAGKIWVNMNDFITAWLVGLSLFGHRADVKLVRATIERAQHKSERRALPDEDEADAW